MEAENIISGVASACRPGGIFGPVQAYSVPVETQGRGGLTQRSDAITGASQLGGADCGSTVPPPLLQKLMPYQWVWLGQVLKTKPENNAYGRKSPKCKAYSALYPSGHFKYCYAANELVGPIKGIYGCPESGYLTVLVPHKDGSDLPDVFVNISQHDRRFATIYLFQP